MLLNPQNFLALIKNIVTGGGRNAAGTVLNDAGFAVDKAYPLASLQAAGQAATLTAATGSASTTIADVTATPTQTLVNNNFKSLAVQINNIINQLNGTALETNFKGIVSPASTTAVGSISLTVPREYDENTDTFAVKMLAAMAGTTDSPIVTATVYIKRAGAVLATGAVTSAKTITGTAAAIYEFDLAKNGLKRDDSLTITFVAGSHTTDAINIYGVAPVLRSCLVSYSETDGTNAESGNLLR